MESTGQTNGCPAPCPQGRLTTKLQNVPPEASGMTHYTKVDHKTQRFVGRPWPSQVKMPRGLKHALSRFGTSEAKNGDNK